MDISNLNDRIRSLKKREDEAHTRAAAIFWYFSNCRSDRSLYLPSDKDPLNGWSEVETSIMKFLGRGGFSFQELEDRIAGESVEDLSFLCSMLQIKLGIVEISNRYAKEVLGIDGVETDLVNPNQVIEAIDNPLELQALSCGGLSVVGSERPIPCEAFLCIYDNKDALDVFSMYLLENIDELYKQYKIELC